MASLYRKWLDVAAFFVMTYGSVWESNPLGALFKPPAGFEDQGQHQLCKHSRELPGWTELALRLGPQRVKQRCSFCRRSSTRTWACWFKLAAEG